jgi:hypothetical protein
MKRSAKVTAVFEEFCEVMGEGHDQTDLLRLAENVVEMSRQDYVSPAANDREYGTPFENWSLDTAFADGGWRVLCRDDLDHQRSIQEERKEYRVHAGLVRYMEEYR